jgi:hypothetical protein
MKVCSHFDRDCLAECEHKNEHEHRISCGITYCTVIGREVHCVEVVKQTREEKIREDKNEK